MFPKPKVWHRHLDGAYRRAQAALTTPATLADLPAVRDAAAIEVADRYETIREVSRGVPEACAPSFKQEVHAMDAYFSAHNFRIEALQRIDDPNCSGVVWRVTDEEDTSVPLSITVGLMTRRTNPPIITVYR